MTPTDETQPAIPGGHKAPRHRFETLNLARDIAAPLAVLWEVWTAPAARAVWAMTDEDQPAAGWLHLDAPLFSVHAEMISPVPGTASAALVTADLSGSTEDSRIALTVQLSRLAEGNPADVGQWLADGLDRLAEAAERTMVLDRVIRAPRRLVWGAWMNAETLPQWWGPDGFSCRTSRIDLRAGGEWVFDMIAPDGQVFPNHHRYGEVLPEERIAYTLHWGENGPKHADAWARFEDVEDGTRVTLCMIFNTPEEFREAKGFGAVELGLQTLGKLERFVLAR